MKMVSRHYQCGLTLLELLISLVLTGLIVTLLSGSLFLADESLAKTGTLSQSTSQLRQMQYLMDRYVATQRPVWIQSEGEKLYSLFSGTSRKMTLVSEMPTHLGVAGLYEISLVVDDNDAGLQLRFSRRLLHPDVRVDLPDENDDVSIVLEGLDQLIFSFHDSSQWQDSWQPQPGLPALVRLSAVEDNGYQHHLVVRLNARLSERSVVVSDRYLFKEQAGQP